MQYCGVSDSLMLYQKLHQYKYTNWIDISMENKLYNFKNTPFTETFFNNLNYCINAIRPSVLLRTNNHHTSIEIKEWIKYYNMTVWIFFPKL